MKNIFTSAAILFLPLLCSASTCGRRWCQYRMPLCLDESSALTTWSSQSLHACVLKASGSPDDLVLQWNRQTGVCALFRYQRVCGAMRASGAEPIGAGGAGDEPEAPQCSLYRSMSLASCSASLDARLIGVWLAGGPAANRFTNLVCQSGAPTAAEQRLESAGLQWTEEGARFDGQSSYALLNDSRFVSSDPSASFTWLMRLKRQPRVQPFLEVVPCSNPNEPYASHLWEFDSPNRLYFAKTASSDDNINFRFYSKTNLLSSSSEAWIDIGVSVVSGNSSLSYFYFNGSFAEPMNFGYAGRPSISCPILSVGRRFRTNPNSLNGVVRAVAVANDSMTQTEIRRFFALLP